MISFPHAKINIGLFVTGKRSDGYHTIETVFYPVSMCDILEIIPSEFYSFQTSGIGLTGVPAENLVVKAYRFMESKFHLPPVRIHLYKAIPPGSGLGGGSSDAVFTLKMLNTLFSLQQTDRQLKEMAAYLGSDCPFFVGNHPCHATGTGNLLTEIDLDLSSYRTVIVIPPVAVSTAMAYRLVQPRSSGINLPEILKRTPGEWRDHIVNDFENPVFKIFPVIAGIKNALLDAGALYSSMSGSGSAVYGIFSELPPNLSGMFHPSCQVYTQ
jgi:4-diphosphocytidyl-2-C-methyl-D-erythritol kinase